MKLEKLLMGKGRLSRRLLGPFFLIVVVLATAGMTVTTRITTQSLEARARSQLANDARIVAQRLEQLEADLIFYSQLLADMELLTEKVGDPTVSRSMVISLLTTLQQLHMRAHLYKEPLSGTDPRASLVQKGFLGFRTVSLTRNPSLDEKGAFLEAVAPLETREGISRVVVLSFPLAPEFLREIRRQTVSDITLLLPEALTISTLNDSDLKTLRGKTPPFGLLDPLEKPAVFSSDLPSGPTTSMVSPLLVNLRQEGLLLLTMPMGDLLAAKRTILTKGLLVTVAILSAASLIYLSLIRRVTKPLEELSAATLDIARGNLDLQMAVTTEDEIGDLAASFNTMVKQLRESRQEIEEWGRTLEQRVEERTRELEQARNELQETNIRLMQALQELRQAQTHMIQSEKLASLGRLVAGVAHEVINPINAIDLICQKRLRRTGDERETRDLKVIREQVRRVVKITESLKSFARQAPQELRLVDINALLQEVLTFIEAGMRGDKIHIHTELTENLPRIRADTDQIRQVLVNIISNAWDAMPEGGHLYIRTAPADRMVEVSITDTGHGIPEEYLPRIFDPFFTTKPEGKGTGLGLSICHGIIETHSGSIDVESQVGQGTTFTIRLPVEPPFRPEDQPSGDRPR